MVEHSGRVRSSRCTVALLLEVDPVELARPAKGHHGSALGRYVNDRPYAAASLLSVSVVCGIRLVSLAKTAERIEN